VIPVTILAARSQLITTRDGFAMERFGVESFLGNMAFPALDGLQTSFVRQLFSREILVTRDARQRSVDRLCKSLLFDEYRYLLSSAGPFESLIAMTAQTVSVFLCTRRSHPTTEEQH
jgi:hypothetical protein